MIKKTIILFAFIMCSINQLSAASDPLVLISNGKSDYNIVVSVSASTEELHAAATLQTYLKKISGLQLSIIKDSDSKGLREIIIGHTNRSPLTVFQYRDEVLIKVMANHLALNGGGTKGVLYAVYSFLERFLGCRKYAADYEVIPRKTTITIPSTIAVQEKPDFNYREVYYPDSKDQTYLDWHKLTRLDDVWGLWGHSFDKLVPAKTYFDKHPEYYAWVDGKRKASQLCLSNPQVLKIVLRNLKTQIDDNPQMKYWSVSQNDDLGYCECNRCKAVDQQEGGPQGSIIRFVNKVATKFPDKIISTLAYTYSQSAPRLTKPAANVQVMLCSIDCNRSKPIVSDPRSNRFKRDLKNWSELTKNLFVWDYNVQFTNYVSPFPNLGVLEPNADFFKLNKVKGIFFQGSGGTPAEFSELRGYLLAKLTWDSKADVQQLTTEFLSGYYGKAAPFIQQYITALEGGLKTAGQLLDIYGNPVSVHSTYLSPPLLDHYGKLFDQAELAVRNAPAQLKHVQQARLAVEFAVLQQSRFYGIEKHGAFIQNESGVWISKPAIERKVKSFVQTANAADITELSEGGKTPDQYELEWKEIFKAGPKVHLAIHAPLKALIPFSEEYQNKGIKTLVDGSRGYADYQYNWLGWYGTNMEVVIDLEKETPINQVSTGFLEDQRHWAFLPTMVTYSFSPDGENYTSMEAIQGPLLYENYDIATKDYTLDLPTGFKSRYIKVKAVNMVTPPAWRYYSGRKTWIFADEIMIH
jgi:hypothetical protein